MTSKYEMKQSSAVPEIPIEDSPFIRILWSMVKKAAAKLKQNVVSYPITFQKCSVNIVTLYFKRVSLQLARNSLSSKHFRILFRVMYLDMSIPPLRL